MACVDGNYWQLSLPRTVWIALKATIAYTLKNSMVSQNSIRYTFKKSMVSQVLRGRTFACLDRPIKNAPPNEHLRWEEKFEKWSQRSAGNWGWRVFVPYGGKRIFSEGRDDGIWFILKSLEEQCVPKIYICVDFISISFSKRMKLKGLLKSAMQMGTSSSINSCALKAK